MQGGSSKKHEANEGIMELDKLSKKLEQQDPPLSGAYIRSLVKQLTNSTRTTRKGTMNTKDQGCVVDGDILPVRNPTKHGKVVDSGQAHQSTQPQQHKKQVRRRLHTSRPYQERLLNMAEARKEIVTALKFHRAAMKQASENQQKQQQQQQQEAVQEQQQMTSVSLQPSQQPSFVEQDGRFKSRRNPRIYPSCTTNFANYMDDFSCSDISQPPSVAPNSYTWPNASPIAPPPQPLLAEDPNFILPNQTLGLNLNFRDFDILDANATLHLNNSSLSSYSSQTSSSSPLSVVTDQEAHSVGMSLGQGEGSFSLADTIQASATTRPNGDLHRAMDDEGMAEIRSLGEQYQMEWGDTMNLVQSASWFKFLRNMENEAPEAKNEYGAYHTFNEFLEFPAWLNANGSCLEKCSEDYVQDSTLPCMDIGDIESMDEDWLA